MYSKGTAAAVAVVISALSLLTSFLLYSPAPAEHNRCIAAERNGWWISPSAKKVQWQANGCTLRQYSTQDVAQCTGDRKRHFVFIGDSSVRDKFYAYTRLVDASFGNQGKVHADIHVYWPQGDGGNRTLAGVFIWDPYLDKPETRDLLGGRGLAPNPDERPVGIVLGSGTWFLRNAESGGVRAWAQTIDVLGEQIARQRTASGHDTIADHVVFSPLPHVVPSLLNPSRRQTLQPDTIAWMNAYAEDVSELRVMGAWRLMTAGAQQHTSDGLHYDEAVEDAAVNVLLNTACNAHVLRRSPPFRETCCLSYPEPSRVVVAFAVLGLVVVPALAVVQARCGAVAWLPSVHTLGQMSAFSGVLAVAFASDRTQLLGKLHKHFSWYTFAPACVVIAAAGAATMRRQPAGACGFLNRVQTDEWKGWMQLVILVYHRMGASQVPVVYNPVRVLVAMYLFMTGYGNFIFFQRTGDFSLRRLTAVLSRINLLAAAQAYVLGTCYMDYYFAPLVSVWVLIVWATMRVFPHLNRTHYIWPKLALSALLVHLFNRHELWPFAALDALGVHWSAREWAFRFGTDIYIPYIGMAVAALRPHASSRLARYAIAPSLAAIGWYAWFSLRHPLKLEYNRIHPFISPIPVLAFVALRNSSQTLRSWSSSAMAEVGKVSLELFVAQFHIWLAADTKGILVLFNARLAVLDFVLSSAVFWGLCRVLHDATAAISEWLVAGVGDEKELESGRDEHMLAWLPLWVRWAAVVGGLILLNNVY